MADVFASFETALKKGRLPEAETLARHLLARSPEDERSHVALARMLAARGDVAAAVDHLTGLLAAHEGLAFSQAWLAVMLGLQGDHARARQLATEALQQGVRVPEALLLLAEEHTRSGEPQKAWEVLGQALEHDPACAPAWRALARLMTGLRRTGEAAQALENAVAAAPQDVDAWMELVKTRLALSDGPAAAEALTRALTHHPRHAELLALAPAVRLLATATTQPLAVTVEEIRLHVLQGKLPAARALLDTTLAAHKMTRALRLLRLEWECAGPGVDVQGQLVNLNSLLKEQPDAWEVRTLLARLLLRKSPVRNPRHALTQAEEGWRMSGGHAAAAVALVAASVATGRTGLAQAVADQARAANPAYAALLDQALGVARP